MLFKRFRAQDLRTHRQTDSIKSASWQTFAKGESIQDMASQKTVSYILYRDTILLKTHVQEVIALNIFKTDKDRYSQLE